MIFRLDSSVESDEAGMRRRIFVYSDAHSPWQVTAAEGIPKSEMCKTEAALDISLTVSRCRPLNAHWQPR